MESWTWPDNTSSVSTNWPSSARSIGESLRTKSRDRTVLTVASSCFDCSGSKKTS